MGGTRNSKPSISEFKFLLTANLVMKSHVELGLMVTLSVKLIFMFIDGWGSVTFREKERNELVISVSCFWKKKLEIRISDCTTHLESSFQVGLYWMLVGWFKAEPVLFKERGGIFWWSDTLVNFYVKLCWSDTGGEVDGFYKNSEKGHSRTKEDSHEKKIAQAVMAAAVNWI